MRGSRFSSEQGFTLVEVMVAAAVLLVGVFGSVALIDGANATTTHTQAREGGTNLARELIEDARAIPYDQLTSQPPAPGAAPPVQSQLQAQPGLSDADPAAPGWTIQRRGFTYTVTVSVCSVDDQGDGTGPHANDGTRPWLDSVIFCPGGVAAGSVDSDPEDYKRVTVDVSWRQAGSDVRHVRQTDVVPNPGNAAGVAVQVPLGPPSISGPPCGTGTYTVTTSRPATQVEWAVDGNVRGNATGSGTSWSFGWTPDLPDGAHFVSAQAYDGFGRSAGSRAVIVTTSCGIAQPASPPPSINSPPTAPSNLGLTVGGNNLNLTWTAATDPDPGDQVAKYNVYRDSVRIATVTGTSYRDVGAAKDPHHTYWVTAVDTHGAESGQSNSVTYRFTP